MRKGRAYEEVRIQVVKEALAGIKVGVLARRYETHPETIRSWIRQYRDQIDITDLPSTDAHVQEMKRLQDLEDKYKTAMKLLGEKELELDILRELVKKKNPAWPTSSKSPTDSPRREPQ